MLRPQCANKSCALALTRFQTIFQTGMIMDLDQVFRLVLNNILRPDWNEENDTLAEEIIKI